jgi:hypothetical protein
MARDGPAPLTGLSASSNCFGSDMRDLIGRDPPREEPRTASVRIGACRDYAHAERVSAALARLGLYVATVGREVVTPGWSDDSIHVAERHEGTPVDPDPPQARSRDRAVLERLWPDPYGSVSAP